MTSQRKDFYKSLGLNKNASQQEIDVAYQKLSSQSHPDRNPDDRLGSQQRFNDVTESYINLSNPARRHEYDVLTGTEYSVDDAYKIFDRFYDDRGVLDEEEKEFFGKHYPQRRKNYYEILGVKRNAPLDEIKRSYKKMGLKYHPKANPGDKDAESRFLEISEAYNHLSDFTKRNIYDVGLSGEIKSNVAHNIYRDSKALRENEQRHLQNIHPTTEYAESVTESHFTQKTPQGVTGKAIFHKSSYENGKRNLVSTEETIRPDGTRDVVETVNEDGRITTNKYTLAAGEKRRELTSSQNAQNALKH